MIFVIAILIGLAIVCTGAKARRQRVEDANRPFQPSKVLGSAGFVTDKQLKKAGYFKKGGIRLGFSPSGKHPLYYHGFGHILLVAGARMGKAFTVVVATILSLGRRCLLVFDPKCELTHPRPN